MKYLILTLVLAATIAKSQAQEKADKKYDIAEVKLDLLKAQSSPASSLLGFAVSDIEKPTDLSDFMVSVQSASSSYTKLPSSYAVDLAPFYLFRNKGADFSTTGVNGLQSREFKNYFRQSFVLSIALRNPDSTFNNFKSTSSYGALGIKFSLIRPQYDQQTKDKLSSIQKKQETVTEFYYTGIKERRENSFSWKILEEKETSIRDSVAKLPGLSHEERSKIFIKMQDDEKTSFAKVLAAKVKLEDEFKAEIKTEIAKRPEISADLEEEAKSFTGNRQGLSLDIAGGLSNEFREKRFDNSKIFNSGVWATFGYNWSDGSSLLGLGRYLYNPDEIFALNNATNTTGDISTFDAGLRYLYSKGKFGASGEAIYRSVLSTSTIKPCWRLVINADYAIAANQKIIFSFGRNFDGTIKKEGNLIAALTVLFGFGTSR